MPAILEKSGTGTRQLESPVYQNQFFGEWKSPTGKYVVLKTGVGTVDQGRVVSIEDLIPAHAREKNSVEIIMTRLLKLGSVRFANEFEATQEKLASLDTNKTEAISLEQILSQKNQEIRSLKADISYLNAEVSILRKNAPPPSAFTADVEKQFKERQVADERRIAELETSCNDLRNQNAKLQASLQEAKTVQETQKKSGK